MLHFLSIAKFKFFHPDFKPQFQSYGVTSRTRALGNHSAQALEWERIAATMTYNPTHNGLFKDSA